MDKSWAVVMAGGRGTRFWPRSRGRMPKQCLPLGDDLTLIQQTVARITPLIPADRVLVVTGSAMADEIREQLPQIPPANVLVEPRGRNTSPCVAWATAEILSRGGTAMVVLPADHRIEQPSVFRSVVKAAIEAAEESQKLVLLGQTPTRPETGFGYLGLGDKVSTHQDETFYEVDRFIEKPNSEEAARLIGSGGVLWNGGMFVWTVSAITRAFKAHLPNTAAAIESLVAGADISSVWTDMDAVSIDYGVLEHDSGEIIAVACEFGWSDLGSYLAVAPHMPQDELGAAQTKMSVAIDGGGHIVYAPDKLVATLGVSDLIIVDTEDALMVCSKSESHRIPEILKKLKELGDNRFD